MCKFHLVEGKAKRKQNCVFIVCYEEKERERVKIQEHVAQQRKSS
jgi:hypothetical protein